MLRPSRWQAAGTAGVISGVLLISTGLVQARNGDNCLRMRVEAFGRTVLWNEEGIAQSSAQEAWQRATAAKAGDDFKYWKNARAKQLTRIAVSKSTIKYRAAATPCKGG